MKEAMLWEKVDGEVRCNVCGRRCIIPEGKTGFCGVRKNIKGRLYSLVYGKACSTAVDPIEKKPFFHFAPGSRSFSVATVGCNFRCDFCQNWMISQFTGEVKGTELSPKDLVTMALNNHCEGMAYTYTEPTIFLEYAYDTMLEAETKLYNVFVSNGYMTKETVKLVAPHLDAINIDYKGSEIFYRKLCSVPGVEPIKETMIEMKRRGVWVEVTNLIIPGYNDDPYHIEEMAKFIYQKLGPETPLHFSRFHPDYKMLDVKITPLETIEKAIRIAKDVGLYYVYSGNVPGHINENTYCYNCGELLIERDGLRLTGFNLGEDLLCPNCGSEIHIQGKRWIPENLFKGS
ncbi:MAG: AmmeMemoRadiSam system radical SAM enzyme [Candidatus Aenigmatarchaeota archaeon]|mgnify:CR=1 FL=1|nr:MAG: AmmeMemoRadiSam system radical SAM enzyme [Candidatus Aenigmarchaeota archaeon]